MSRLKIPLTTAVGLLTVVPCLGVDASERNPSTAGTERHSVPTGSGRSSLPPPPAAPPAAGPYSHVPVHPSGRPPPLDPATTHYWSEKCVSQRASSLPIQTGDCDNPAYSTGYPYYPRPYGYPPYPPAYGSAEPFIGFDHHPWAPQPPEPPGVPEYRPRRKD